MSKQSVQQTTMGVKEILSTLKQLGKLQTAAIYKRMGSGENVFGTLTSEMAKLAKRIKVDHELSMELWETGNIEARVLALLIADPARVTKADAERWLESGQTHFLCCYLCELLARSPIAEATMRAWMKSRDESKRELGYSILSYRLKIDPGAISDGDAVEILATIEKEIHGSPNWGRYAMNGAVIAIGCFRPTLAEKATEAAKRIGKVHVDHGETYCKTPEAVAYIAKVVKRRKCP